MNKYCIVLYYICFQETIISEHESEKGVFLAGPEWKVLSVCQSVSPLMYYYEISKDHLFLCFYMYAFFLILQVRITTKLGQDLDIKQVMYELSI